MREIIFDTETTGLSARDGDRVIEIGAIELINRFPTGRTFHQYLNPGDRDVHPDAEAVHGLSNAMLKDKPGFAEIIDDFLEFFNEGNLVAHNASFDMSFLNAEMNRLKLPLFDPTRVVDSLAIARRKHPGSPASLDALCSRYGISNAHRTLHGALLDSELLAEVYLELTGGRQAGLGLETQEAETSNTPRRAANSYKPQPQRPAPLPSRLSEEDDAAHKDFIAGMGDKAIWRRWEKAGQ